MTMYQAAARNKKDGRIELREGYSLMYFPSVELACAKVQPNLNEDWEGIIVAREVSVIRVNPPTFTKEV